MMKIVNSQDVHAPVALYSHAIEASGSGRWLYISGQVGISKSGNIAEGFEAQAELAWQNLIAVLMSSSMGVDNIVRINQYVVDNKYLPVLTKVRQKYQGAVRPASTLVIVKGLVADSLLYEIEAVAYKD